MHRFNSYVRCLETSERRARHGDASKVPTASNTQQLNIQRWLPAEAAETGNVSSTLLGDVTISSRCCKLSHFASSFLRSSDNASRVHCALAPEKSSGGGKREHQTWQAASTDLNFLFAVWQGGKTVWALGGNCFFPVS